MSWGLPAVIVSMTLVVSLRMAVAGEDGGPDRTADSGHSHRQAAADLPDARGLDVRSRIALARRLGTSHAVAFPDARESLVTMAIHDASEPVRYEAVLALRTALARHAAEAGPAIGCENVLHRCSRSVRTHARCSSRPRGLIRRLLARVFGGHRERSAETLTATEPVAFSSVSPETQPLCDSSLRNALSEIVNGHDERGRFREPSLRVRAGAAAALSLCGIEPQTTPDTEDAPPLPGRKHDAGEKPEIEEPPADSLDFEPLAAMPNARGFHR